MKKIGIVTWHKGNIGGTLQAYALSTTLRKRGYETELINCFDSRLTLIKRKIRNLAFHVIYYKSALTRDYTNLFIKNNVDESPNLLYNDLAEYSNKFDAVICGSDQIWSCVNEVNPLYFLQFCPQQKRISYAPSIGLNDIKHEFKSRFKEYVSTIPYLSVRESRGAEIVESITGLVPKVVLDPTLLLNKEEWLSVSEEASVEKFGLKRDDYILCYYLGNQDLYMSYTQNLSNRTGKKAIYVSFKRKHFGKDQIVCSIEEFLALVRDSSYVLTDSFHGTVIPLNLCKKVAVFERFSPGDPLNQNSRIYNILGKLNVEDWIVSPDDDVDQLINRIDDYVSIQSCLNLERVSSLRYLEDSVLAVCGPSE